MFPSPCGDEYNPETPTRISPTSRFRPLAGMSIIKKRRNTMKIEISFRPLAGMSIIIAGQRTRSELRLFPSPCGDEYNR